MQVLKRGLALLLVAWLAAGLALAHDLTATPQGRERVFNALVDLFRKHYWKEDYLDWDSWAESYRDAALAAETRSAFDSVARRMVYALGDNHSSWVGRVDYIGDPSALPEETARFGVGVQHALLPGVGVVIERVFPQTPAHEAGLKRGDVIVRINGEDLRSVARSSDVESRFASAIASREVKLTVRRKQQHLSVSLTPRPIRFGEVQSLPTAEMLDAATGYLYLPTFNMPNVAREAHRLLKELQAQGAEALILDLRGNLGGRISELGLVLGAFIEGPWAQAVSRGSVAWQGSYRLDGGRGVNLLVSPDASFEAMAYLESPTFFDGPLVVLVDEQNSSAGEIAAMVLQQRGRAKVVGTRTAGNVETIRGFDLPDGSLVMVAVANVVSIDGRAFDQGVTPDVVARAELQELARGFDAPVAEALRLLKALPFTPGKFF
jgi:carboxyl-terminal processing protease